MEEGLCRGTQFIPDVAKDVRKRKDLQDLESKMTSLESRLSTLLQKKKVDLKKLRQNKDEILKDIRVLRKKINDHLDKIEQEFIDETTVLFEVEMQNIEADEKKLEIVLAELARSQQQLKAAKYETDSEVFVQMKTSDTSVKKIQDSVDKMEQSGHVPDFKIKFDRTLECFQDEIRVMGKLTELSPNISMTMQREYNCRVTGDNRCDKLHGICLTTRGNILQTDLLNKKLKQINCTDSLVSYLKVPGSPFGICQISDDHFALTLLYEKKVQFVKVDEQMRLLNSFTVGDRCRGVLYNNGVIFVCCGGWEKPTEGPGHIELYNEEGVLLRSYFESIRCPSGLAFSSNGKEMWIADRYNGLIIMDSNGCLLSKNTFKELQQPEAICKLRDDTVCISSAKSGNLVTIVDGNVNKILLTSTGSILAMCFDEKRSQLIIYIYGHEKIKVFEIYR
ncbi:uncharacterized protein LOC123539665 isoform X2 [Mercenaria mercenaria]|uniref:uncharacterized protein LOC123539665 isoform X2 n=1 Tax=Mercenaria mercenaria TaxID=6596 RepID=UPI00234F555B|nr:uncharacterized protein LOC123539665 isoform X2 [Mercenaria mercenaria]